jgi:hypothetical protein
LPDVDSAISSSSSALKPGRMKPPSRMTTGGSSVTARISSSASSGSAPSGPARDLSSPASHRESAAPSRGSCVSDSPNARRSLALPAPSDSRPHSRSRSATSFSVATSSSRHTLLPASSSTASSRAVISGSEHNGADSQRASFRAPRPVAVRSSTPSSDPLRPPSRRLLSTSRLPREDSSITRQPAFSCRDSRSTCAAAVFCVSFR